MAKPKPRWRYTAGRRPYTVAVEEFEGVGSILYVRIWLSEEQKHRWRSLGHRDRERAMAYADRLATRLREGSEEVIAPRVTWEWLFREYRLHRTPQKARDSQLDDDRRIEMSLAVFGPKAEVMSISLAAWERFIELRRSGAIDSRGRQVPPKKRRPVSDRTIEGNLRWLKAVLTWATKWMLPSGQYMLRENPVRGFPIPKNLNPKRSIATHDRLEKIKAVADQITFEYFAGGRRLRAQSYLPELLDIVNGTGRRIAPILQLRFEDLRLNEGPFGSIRWPADSDKMGYESLVPINPEVRAAIDRVLEDRPGIGRGFLFPSPRNPSQPLRYELASSWLIEAEKLAGVPKLDRALWHAYRRKFATERKHLSDIDVAAAGGWRSARTLVEIYQRPDADSMLKVVLEGGQLREQSS